MTQAEKRERYRESARRYHEENKARIQYRHRYKELGEVFERFGYVLRGPDDPAKTYDEMKKVFQKYGYVIR